MSAIPVPPPVPPDGGPDEPDISTRPDDDNLLDEPKPKPKPDEDEEDPNEQLPHWD